MSQYLFTISFFYYLHVAVVLEVGDVRVECVGGAEGGDTADTRTVDHCVHRLYASAVTHSFDNLMYFIKICRRG